MPFIKLNGMTIPTAKGASLEYTEIGSRMRSPMGFAMKDIRALKRRWQLRTVPMSELRSLPIVGLIQGQGLYLPANSSSTTPTNGRVPDGTVVTVKSYAAADGVVSRDEYGVTEAPAAGTYSFVREDATTPNLLTTAVATATTTAGITPTDCTLSIDNTAYWQGNSSVRMQMGGNPSILYTSLYTGALNTRYIVSCYLRLASGSGSASVAITLSDSVNGGSATSTPVVLTSAQGWRRFTISFTTASSGSTPNLRLLINAAAGFGTEGAMFVDALQLEINSFGTFPRTFQLPGTALASGDFRFINEEFAGPSGMTLSYWQNIPPYLPSTFGLEMATFGTTKSDGTQRYFRVGIAAANQSRLDFTTGDSGDNIAQGGLTFTGWHHVVAVMRPSPETGEAKKSFYFDGVLKATANPSIMPDSINSFYIGGFQSNPAWNKLTDIQLLPYAVDSATVASWYSAGVGVLGSPPLLTASGDFIGESAVTVAGSVDRISTVGYYDSRAGTWRNNGRSIEFTLEEV